MGRPFVVAALLTLLAAHLVVRLLSVPDVWSDAREPLFASSDSFYHAHRIQQQFEGFPVPVFRDRMMFYPEGAIPHWPLGFEWSAAAVLRGLTSEWSTALWWLPWVSVLLSVVTLVCFVALAWALMPPLPALLTATGFALNLAFVRVSTPAELDHHVVESLCIVCLLALPLVLSRRRQPAVALALGAGLGWTIWNTTLLAFPVGGFFVLWMIALQRADRHPPPLLPLAAGLLPTLCLAAAAEAGARGAPLSLTTLSWLHAGIVGGGLGVLALSRRFSALRLWTALGVGALTVGVLALGKLSWLASFLGGGDPIIANLNEARPLLLGPTGFTLTSAHALFGPAYLLAPLAIGALGVDALGNRRTAKPTLGSIVLMAACLLLLSLLQKRFAHLFAPAYVLSLGLWASRLPRPRLVWPVLLLLLLEPLPAFWFELAHPIPMQPRLYVQVAHAVADAARGRPERGVSTPPNLGSVINYAAGLPSVTNGFMYPDYLREDLKLRRFESSEALIAHLRSRRIGYLVTADDARYLTMLLRMVGDDTGAAQAASIERQPCQGPWLRLAYYRIACDRERPTALQPLLRVQRSDDPGLLWRKVSAFRIADP